MNTNTLKPADRPQDSLVVELVEVGLRLDQLLADRFPSFSRAYFQRLISEGLVLINGEVVPKRTLVCIGDEIEVEFTLTRQASIDPEPIPLDILYEDSHLLAINKAAGMVVHPATSHWSGTFVNALLYHCQNLNASSDSIRPGIVHRLDRFTSGILVAAKHEQAQHRLVDLFANRQVYKEYRAICVGNPGSQTIDAPLGRHPKERKKRSVQEEGKLARTTCHTLCFDGQLSVVQLILETGRTHQIRVHLQHVRCPVLGDPMYGYPSWNQKLHIDRQLLHAAVMRLKHPMTGEELEFKAPLPHDLANLEQRIRRSCEPASNGS